MAWPEGVPDTWNPALKALGHFVAETIAEVGGGEGGADGASAYEVAVVNGFEGTEAEWLASLVGEAGADGAPGADGNDGAPGVKGDKGDKGDTGDTGPAGADGVSLEDFQALEDRVAALEGAPDPEPEPELFTDSFTGTDADPWSSEKWTVSTILEGAETGIADIQSNHGRLRTTGNAANNLLPVVRAIADVVDANHADIDLLLTGITYSAGPSSGRYFGVFVRASGDWDQSNQIGPDTGYRVLFGRDGSVGLIRIDTGGETSLGTSTWTATQNTNVRIQIIGSAIKVRTWQEGTSEPSTWAIEATDATHASGTVQLVIFTTGTNTTTTDWLIDQIDFS